MKCESIRAGFATRYMIETLERRVLLADDLISAVSLSLLPNPFSDPISSGYQTTLHGQVVPAAGNPLDQVKSHIPSGSIVVQWWGGAVVATMPVIAVPTPNDPTGYAGYPQVDDVVVTLNADQAGTKWHDFNLLTYYFTGGGGYAGTHQFDQADFDADRVGIAHMIKFSDSPTSGTEDHLQFIQPPDDSTVGEPLEPGIRVGIFDNHGNKVAAAHSTISISLSSDDPDAHLTGTLSALPVDGVATFNDLTIDKAGSYQLIATSTGPAPQIFSSPFDVSDTKLVFPKTPKGGQAGDSLAPFTVELRDGDNKLLSDDNGSLITLTPVGFNGDAPITGDTATTVNGVATFDNVVLKKPGSYQLQASSGNSAVATTSKFKVTGGKLAVNLQPTTTNVNAPVDLVAVVKDAKGKIDTSATTFAQLTLNRVDPASTAMLSGTIVRPFLNGVATFGGDVGPIIDQPGKYTFTITEVESSLGAYVDADTSTPVDTKQFQIGGYKLKFSKTPVAVDVDKKLSFAVTQIDPKNKVNTKLNSHHVQLTLTAIEGGTGATLSDFTNVGFTTGVQTFDADTAPSIDRPGTYTLTATEVDANNVPVDTTESVTSKPFKVSGYHIVFMQQPKAATVDRGVPMLVGIANSKNKIDTTQSTAQPTITITPVAGGDTPQSALSPFKAFSAGELEFADPGESTDADGVTKLTVHALGSFTATVGATVPGQPDGLIESTTSKAFKVLGEHIVFQQQPTNVSSQGGISFKVAVVDSKNKVDTEFNNANVNLDVTGGSAGWNQPYTVVQFEDGVATYPKNFGGGSPGAYVNELGTYQLVVKAESSGGVLDQVEAGTSKKFKVLPLKLTFLTAPASTQSGFPTTFNIGFLDLDGNQQTFVSERNIQIAYRSISAGKNAPTTQVGFALSSSGVAEFDPVLSAAPGTYVLVATDMSDIPATSVTSGVFSILP